MYLYIMKLIGIIKEELKLLNEGLSDILYHFTDINSVQNILNTNKLNTSSNLGTLADAQKDKGKSFYFSTQRSKGKSGYGYNTGDGAVLVLDGKKIMSKYKGFPIDYWNWSMSRKDYSDEQGYINALRSKELEDRIVTNEPYIEPASDYIKEIHIDLSRPWYLKKSDAINIEHKAKELGIPIYFYNNKNQYQLQNKVKALPLESINTEFQDEEHESYKSKHSDFIYIFKDMMPYISFNTIYETEFWQLLMEYLESEDKAQEFNQYKQEIDKRISEIHEFYKIDRQKHWYYIKDTYTSLMASFHNHKSSTDPYYREFLKLLIKDMREFKTTNLKQYLINKLGLDK